jgi:FKBP12-rapamycin complex-associated protein
VLRELATATPTFFFQQVQQFFEVIFNGVRDPKPQIREGAVNALRQALIVTSQRENIMTQTHWYKQCFEESKSVFNDVNIRERGVTKDDKIHGSLLVLNELLRISNNEWERTYNELNADLNLTGGPKPKEPKESFFKIKKSHAANFPKINQLSATAATTCESAACKKLLLDHYHEICKIILDSRTSKSLFIQNTLLTILPRLASLNVTVFSAEHG